VRRSSAASWAEQSGRQSALRSLPRALEAKGVDSQAARRPASRTVEHRAEIWRCQACG
jgi:hypothetical protein